MREEREKKTNRSEAEESARARAVSMKEDVDGGGEGSLSSLQNLQNLQNVDSKASESLSLLLNGNASAALLKLEESRDEVNQQLVHYGAIASKPLELQQQVPILRARRDFVEQLAYLSLLRREKVLEFVERYSKASQVGDEKQLEERERRERRERGEQGGLGLRRPILSDFLVNGIKVEQTFRRKNCCLYLLAQAKSFVEKSLQSLETFLEEEEKKKKSISSSGGGGVLVRGKAWESSSSVHHMHYLHHMHRMIKAHECYLLEKSEGALECLRSLAPPPLAIEEAVPGDMVDQRISFLNNLGVTLAALEGKRQTGTLSLLKALEASEDSSADECVRAAANAVHYNVGLVLLSGGDYKSALFHLSKALLTLKHDPSLWMRCAQCATMLSKQQAKREDEEEQNREGFSMLQHASECLKLGFRFLRFPAASKTDGMLHLTAPMIVYKSYADLRSYQPQACVSSGLNYLEIKFLGEEPMKLEDYYVTLYCAEALMHLGKFSEAEGVLTKYLKLIAEEDHMEEERTTLHVNLAYVYAEARQRRYAEAERSSQKAYFSSLPSKEPKNKACRVTDDALRVQSALSYTYCQLMSGHVKGAMGTLSTNFTWCL